MSENMVAVIDDDDDDLVIDGENGGGGDDGALVDSTVADTATPADADDGGLTAAEGGPAEGGATGVVEGEFIEIHDETSPKGPGDDQAVTTTEGHPSATPTLADQLDPKTLAGLQDLARAQLAVSVIQGHDEVEKAQLQAEAARQERIAAEQNRLAAEAERDAKLAELERQRAKDLAAEAPVTPVAKARVPVSARPGLEKAEADLARQRLAEPSAEEIAAVALAKSRFAVKGEGPDAVIEAYAHTADGITALGAVTRGNRSLEEAKADALTQAKADVLRQRAERAQETIEPPSDQVRRPVSPIKDERRPPQPDLASEGKAITAIGKEEHGGKDALTRLAEKAKERQERRTGGPSERAAAERPTTSRVDRVVNWTAGRAANLFHALSPVRFQWGRLKDSRWVPRPKPVPAKAEPGTPKGAPKAGAKAPGPSAGQRAGRAAGRAADGLGKGASDLISAPFKLLGGLAAGLGKAFGSRPRQPQPARAAQPTQRPQAREQPKGAQARAPSPKGDHREEAPKAGGPSGPGLVGRAATGLAGLGAGLSRLGQKLFGGGGATKPAAAKGAGAGGAGDGPKGAGAKPAGAAAGGGGGGLSFGWLTTLLQGAIYVAIALAGTVGVLGALGAIRVNVTLWTVIAVVIAALGLTSLMLRR